MAEKAETKKIENIKSKKVASKTTDKSVGNKTTTKKPATKSVSVKKVATTKRSTTTKKTETVVKQEVTPKKKSSTTNTEQKIAVVDVNGTQLLVEEGKTYEINKLDGIKGDSLEITKVLLYASGTEVKVGKPYIKDAKVVAKIDSQKKGDKLRVFKFKAKSRYRRTYGSRALITRLEIVQITA